MRIPDAMREEYRAYINSARWKRIREARIKRAGYKCEKCGITKWSVKLEVHHRHYDNFKHEKLEDLEVLCPKCHEKEDEKRELNTRIKQQDRLWDARLDGWATKVYGKYWQDGNTDFIEEKFYDWLERNK